MSTPRTGRLVLAAALAAAGVAPIVMAQVIGDPPEEVGIPFDTCGTLQAGPGGCVDFVTHNGGTYSLATTGPFGAGDAVCVSGTAFTADSSSCTDGTTCITSDGCVMDNTITAAEIFEGCGQVVNGPQGCLGLDTDDGRGFLLAAGLNGLAVGEHVWVSGYVVPQTQGCGEATGDELVPLEVLPCREGDANRDGVVNVQDLLRVLADWGCIGCNGDVDNDDDVDVSDLLMVLANWDAA